MLLPGMLLLAATATAAHAATIKGIAVENLTGFPVARAQVTLIKLGSSGYRTIQSVNTGRPGTFQFNNLADGYYQLLATRPGFAEARAGQSYKGGAGTPIFVEGDQTGVAELRLKRLGLVTGRILDDNSVGLPRVPVSAYTSTLPRRILGTAVSDDLGVYRVTGLPPGNYLIRTGTARIAQYEEVIPTYHPFASINTRDARAVNVTLDNEVRDIDIAPVAGRTLTLEIRITGCVGLAQITVSSDHGRHQVAAACNQDAVTVTGLATGEYEVLAEGEANGQKLAAFAMLQLNNPKQQAILNMTPLPSLHLRVDGSLSPTQAGIRLRRCDLAGEGSIVELTNNPMRIQPGYWQIAARPPGGSAYLSDITFDMRGKRTRNTNRDPDWFEFLLDSEMAQVSVMLASSPASVSGKVKAIGTEAIGAPVHLLPLTPETRRKGNGTRTTYASQDGTFRFDGLPPGSYLVLASLEATELTEEALSGRAQPVTLSEGQSLVLELALAP